MYVQRQYADTVVATGRYSRSRSDQAPKCRFQHLYGISFLHLNQYFLSYYKPTTNLASLCEARGCSPNTFVIAKLQIGQELLVEKNWKIGRGYLFA